MAGDSQFIRRWALFLASETGKAGITLADGTDEPGNETLHIRFEIHAADAQYLANYGTVKVWNPPDDIFKKLNQYTRVVLQAGYRDGKYGVILDGWISWFKFGHESAVDSFLELQIVDGDPALVFATVDTTIKEGANDEKRTLQPILDSFKEKGVLPPWNPAGGGPVQARPTVMFGMARDELEVIRKTNSRLWSIEQGRLNYTTNDIAKPGEGVELNAGTGLIGWPSICPDGIEAVCLLNPSTHVKERVKLDNKTLNLSRGTGVGTTGNQLQAVMPGIRLGVFAPISADGTYVALVVEHRGDSRGNEWYTHLVLWPIDSKTGKMLTQDGLLPTDAVIQTEANESFTSNSPASAAPIDQSKIFT